MASVDRLGADDVSEAVVIWTGKRHDAWPTLGDARVVERFGELRGRELVDAVHRLSDEFYESDANQTIADLVEMGAAAAARFRALHPEISDEAVDALEWCYVWDFK